MVKRRSAVTVASIALLSLIVVSGLGAADGDAPPLETQLLSFASELRLGVSLAAFAAYSPTILDLRLHAQQLVNLIEGEEGRHYMRPGGSTGEPAGLLVEVNGWVHQIPDRPLPTETKEKLLAAAKNVATFLGLARDAALSILAERGLERAKEGMLAVYAYLAAAYEPRCGIGYVPGLATILAAFGLDEGTEE